MGPKTRATCLRNAHRGQSYNGKVSPPSFALRRLDELGHDVLISQGLPVQGSS